MLAEDQAEAYRSGATNIGVRLQRPLLAQSGHASIKRREETVYKFSVKPSPLGK